MILKQFYLGCLSQASYLIGDKKTRTAAVVDPRRDVGIYRKFARERGLKIKHVFLTHFHADFAAGHLELQAKGARIYLGSRAKADYPFTPLKEGDAVEFGAVRIQALETPGHTPEGVSLLVFDLSRSGRSPKAVLTGDTLFIGDVGRPDLLVSKGISAKALAGMLYDSLHNKLLPLPDTTLVYPAHGAGSLCGKNLSADTCSTLGVQRRHNYALQPMSRGRFVSLVSREQPPAPSYFHHDVRHNRSRRPTLEKILRKALRPLDAGAFLAAARKAQVLDTRDAADFESAHLAGAVNVGLSGRFAAWAGAVLDPMRPILLICEPGTEKEAALRLGRIGLDAVEGFLGGGMLALKDHPGRIAKTERLTASALAERLRARRRPLVLDVRAPGEWSAARIAGSLNIPLDRLSGRTGEIPSGRPIVVHCQGGYRSAVAAGLLERAGIKPVSDLVGGIAAWQAAGLPVLGPKS